MLPFTFYLDALLKGLLTGTVYAMMAVGLSIIFGVVRVVNFAHGEFLVLAMFLAFWLFTTFGLDPLHAIPIVAAVLFVTGWALQRGLINRFVTAPDYQQFLLLIAIAFMITNGLLMVAGPDARLIDVPYAWDSYEVGGLIIDKARLLAAGVAAAMIAALFFFFGRTRMGKAIRACADNYRGALVVGLDVRKLYAITFGIGLACVGVAGCVLAMLDPFQPYNAGAFTLLAFVIVIVGGLGSMAGALLGGVLIGVSEAMAGILIQPSLKSSFSFGLLILVLLLRPSGLLGRRTL